MPTIHGPLAAGNEHTDVVVQVRSVHHTETTGASDTMAEGTFQLHEVWRSASTTKRSCSLEDKMRNDESH